MVGMARSHGRKEDAGDFRKPYNAFNFSTNGSLESTAPSITVFCALPDSKSGRANARGLVPRCPERAFASSKETWRVSASPPVSAMSSANCPGVGLLLHQHVLDRFQLNGIAGKTVHPTQQMVCNRLNDGIIPAFRC
jgi:hypothetical protein